jgi:hypothetical protein
MTDEHMAADLPIATSTFTRNIGKLVGRSKAGAASVALIFVSSDKFLRHLELLISTVA